MSIGKSHCIALHCDAPENGPALPVPSSQIKPGQPDAENRQRIALSAQPAAEGSAFVHAVIGECLAGQRADERADAIGLSSFAYTKPTPTYLEDDVQTIFKALAVAVAFAANSAWAAIPSGYPGDYQATIDGAKKEGKLIVYSVTDTALEIGRAHV